MNENMNFENAVKLLMEYNMIALEDAVEVLEDLPRVKQDFFRDRDKAQRYMVLLKRALLITQEILDSVYDTDKYKILVSNINKMVQ